MIEHMRTSVVSSGDESNTGNGPGFNLHAQETLRCTPEGSRPFEIARLSAHLQHAGESEAFLKAQECEKHGLMIPRGKPCYRCVIDRNKAYCARTH